MLDGRKNKSVNNDIYEKEQNLRVQEYIKRVRQDRSERDRIRMDNIRRSQDLLKQQEREKREQDYMEIELMRKHRSELSRMKLQQLSEYQQSRKIQISEANKRVNQVLQLIKQQQIQEQEKAFYEAQERERQREQALIELRQSVPAISIDEIREHQRKYLQTVNEREERIKPKMAKTQSQGKSVILTPPKTPIFKKHKKYNTLMREQQGPIKVRATPIKLPQPDRRFMSKIRMRFDADGNPLFEEKCHTENKTVDRIKLGNDYLKELKTLPRVRARSRAQSMSQSTEITTHTKRKINYLAELPKPKINYKSKQSLVDHAKSFENKANHPLFYAEKSDDYLIQSIMLRIKALELQQ